MTIASVSAAPTTRTLRVSFVVAASPSDVYAAWLDSAQHAAMSGYRAEIEPRTFGRFMAGDGYAEGVLLELDRDRRIVQTWRGNDYSKSSPDSRLELHFVAEGSGTRVTIIQDDVPEELAAELDKGWREYYQEPMTAYFAGGQHRRTAKPRTASKKPPRRPKAKATASARTLKRTKTQKAAPKKKTGQKARKIAPKKKTGRKARKAAPKKKTVKAKARGKKRR